MVIDSAPDGLESKPKYSLTASTFCNTAVLPIPSVICSITTLLALLFSSSELISIIKSDLQTIICIGETEEEKNMGLTNKIVCTQLENSMPSISDENNTVIAYEPIWAIGTGRIPSIREIEVVHKELRALVSKIKGKDIANKMRILYGGSVKANNAKDIFDLDDVDGALVGGASLNSEEFMGIINVCQVLYK